MKENVIISDASRFETDVLKVSEPVVVYFYSDDCLPCLTFSEIFDRTAASLGGVMRFIKVFRPQNRALCEEYGISSSPTIMFFKDGIEVCIRLTGYINHNEFKEAIEKVLQRSCSPKQRSIIRSDVLIIGAGPSGLTAAIYTARSRLNTVIIDSNLPGGQVLTTFHVANYPGTNGAIRGLDLAENMKKQSLDFGAQIYDLQQIKQIDLSGEEKFAKTDQADYYAKSVIIATGSEPRKLPVSGEREFRGRGVHYCATCDGALYQDANVAVVGGGISALEEAVFLSRYARSVTIINRSDRFKAPVLYTERTLKNPAITVVWNSVIKELKGDGFLKTITLEDVKTGELSELEIDGIFVYIGMQPNSGLFTGQVKLSEKGYILTDENMSTNIPGVFAAGDVREKDIRQISTAVGDGTIAGIMAEKYVNSNII